jgi:hypothetical protein
MKLLADHDPDFVAFPRPKFRRTRTCALLLILALFVGLSLLSLRAASVTQPVAVGALPVPTARGLTTAQVASGPPVRMLTPQPGDRFVVVANPAIDQEMVHPAPAGIDEGMVVPAREP